MVFKFFRRGGSNSADLGGGYISPRFDERPVTMIEPASGARPAFLDAQLQGDGPDIVNPMLPRFSASASDDIQASAEGPRIARARLALRDALGASQPVTSRDRFAGRHDALAQLIGAIEQQRVHVVIYGERGIGKTSLVHVFADTARDARYQVIYGTCGAQSRFSDMFRAFAAKIPMLYHRSTTPTASEAEHGRNFDSLLPDDAGPREISDIFADIIGTRVILILDEYDRVEDPSFRRDVAELIKNLSDRAARVQLVLTGVASNLDELIGYAPSIRRNITGLPMRGLSLPEVRALLGLGESAAGMHFSDGATAMIATMAGGSPYLVRLIGHRAGLVALDAGQSEVSAAHARTAVEHVVEDWNNGLPRRVQQRLEAEGTRTQWPVLVAAAEAGKASDGWFTAEDVARELSDGRSAKDFAAVLTPFDAPDGLVEHVERHGDIHYRFRFPGVASLLLISSAISRLHG